MILKNLIFIFIILSFGLLSSQNSGNLTGRVLDSQTQLPIQGVTILLENSLLGVATDENGYFTINDIPTKTYNVDISHLGYQSQTIYNIIIKAFGTPPLQILLEESTNELDEIVIQQSPVRLELLLKHHYQLKPFPQLR